MKMKLNALSLAVAAGFIGSAAQAADVAMFPYVVNSPTVTTCLLYTSGILSVNELVA